MPNSIIKKSEKDNYYEFSKSLQISNSPLPPVQDLEKLEKLHPGTVADFIELIKMQTTHRIEIENKVVESNIHVAKMGQIFGFIIIMFVIITGTIICTLGKDSKGFYLIILALCSLISVYIYGYYKKNKELKNKNDKNPEN